MSDTCVHGEEIGSCRFCLAPRKTWSLEDSLALMNSGYGSFEEYRACAETFFNAGRYELGQEAIVASLGAINGRPGDWKLKYANLVASFLQSSIARLDITDDLRQSLKVIEAALEDSEDALSKFGELMQADEHLHDFEELKAMAERVATALALIHKGDRTDLISLANFFRKGFFEWNPKLARRQTNRRDAMRLGLKILDGVLSVDPSDDTARVLRASINTDLRNFAEAEIDLEEVLTHKNPSKFTLLTASRIDYLSGRGFDAWDKIFSLFNQSQEAPLYGILVVSYAVAEMEPGFNDPVSSFRLQTMRNYLDAYAGFTAKESLEWSDRQLLEKNIALNILISDEMFGHAFIYLSELEREGWPGSSKTWLTKLERSATLVNRQPRVEAVLINPNFEDVFPDWLDTPKHTRGSTNG